MNSSWAQLFFVVFLLCSPVPLCAQEPDASAPAPANVSPTATKAQPAATGERAISWKLFVPNVLHDQKPIWLFPARAAQGKHLKPALAFVLATAGLVALDPHDTPYFRRTDSFNGFNRVASGRNTDLANAIFPLSFYAVGLARKDKYAQNTALLAGEAVLDAQLLTLVMKNVDRRRRPVEIPADGDFSHTWFESHGRVISGRGSFPSGHAITAFSVATIFAERYRRHRWVPWVAYPLAGLVGFSRVSLQSHFPSDVFAGAVLGYSISRYVVLQQKP